MLASSFINRYEGNIFRSGSQIAALGGLSDVAVSASTVTAFTSAQTGGAAYFTPCMMLIEAPRSSKCVASVGDSIGYGTFEGQTGSGSYGDSRGSQQDNMAWLSRGCYENAGVNEVNFCTPSDQARWFSSTANNANRMQLLALANPTHLVCQYGHNDMAYSSTFFSWAATTAVAQYTVCKNFSKYYMAIQGGTTSGSNPLGPSSQGIVDGTVIWDYIGSTIAGGSSTTTDGAYLTVANYINIWNQVRAVAPGIKIVQAYITPGSTSTDSWQTATNQTVSSGFGPTSRQSVVRSLLATPMDPTTMGAFALLDPDSALEYNWPFSPPITAETGKWSFNGSPNWLCYDGTHPNSFGYNQAASVIGAGTFG